MMSSAQLDFGPEGAAGDVRGSELRQAVAERLAAHRQRRGRATLPSGKSVEDQAGAGGATSPKKRTSIAAAVAERYAQTPSYRAFLAEEAKRAIERAAASAEVAVRNAEAVVAAQQRLLGELELWDRPQEFTPETARTIANQASSGRSPEPRKDEGAKLDIAAAKPAVGQPAVVAGLTVRLYEDLGRSPVRSGAADRPVGQSSGRRPSVDTAEALALDAEIAFRQSPVFEDYKAYLLREAEPPIPLPANLLEFPRQLIASRKARPRLAEGPLRDAPVPRNQQLRIFEVEAEQISTAPASASASPEWSSIRLDAHTVTEPLASADAPVLASAQPPQTAPLGLRAMAFLVDLAFISLGLIAATGIFVRITGQIPAAGVGAIAAAAMLVVFYVLYQLLFYTLSGQTPGMRYARIGLCTFADENPSRAAMRRRILAQFIAVCPMGLGVLWALLDEDGLGWHDRISRMYQRAY